MDFNCHFIRISTSFPIVIHWYSHYFNEISIEFYLDFSLFFLDKVVGDTKELLEEKFSLRFFYLLVIFGVLIDFFLQGRR